jgi:hypothetical protein
MQSPTTGFFLFLMFQFLTGRNGNFQELVHENLKTYFIRQNFLQLIKT